MDLQDEDRYVRPGNEARTAAAPHVQITVYERGRRRARRATKSGAEPEEFAAARSELCRQGDSAAAARSKAYGS